MSKTDIRPDQYHPEPYWSAVAERISKRNAGGFIAGDDEPYYRYKRKRFLQLLHGQEFKGKRVLEIGPGPGGNLLEILKHQPGHLQGTDISQAMIDIASQNLKDTGVWIQKTDGEHLPFPDDSFDLAFTATVLQHNSDDLMFENLLSEICRVSKHSVLLLEGTDEKPGGTDLYYARTVKYYAQICEKQGFTLSALKYANIRVSYIVCGAIRKIFNKSSRQEGEPLSRISYILETIFLPFTRILDRVVKSKSDLTLMLFEKENKMI